MNLEQIQNELNIHFSNPLLLQEALTHPSYAFEQGLKINNERLEFLGDSVLSVVISEILFKEYKTVDEAVLSKLKSYLVSKSTLSRWARKIKLNKYILLSRSERASGGEKKDSILVGSFEALIGAIYLDKNLDAVKSFIVENFFKKEKIIFRDVDYKTKLQEIAQKKYKTLPVYTVIKEEGPEHDKTFISEVRIMEKVLGIGKGKTKKQSQQLAAKQALQNLKAKSLL